MIIGIDECGLGAWAGPLCVCGVLVKEAWMFPGLNDSKKLTPKKRAELFQQLVEADVRYEVHLTDVEEIDEIGVYEALYKSWRTVALRLLKDSPDATVIVDGDKEIKGLPPGTKHQAVIEADTFIQSVMAASILGKHTRDGIMIRLAEKFPGYKFDSNKGYGTPQHREGLAAHGVCSIHRRSYRPIQIVIENGPHGDGVGYYPVTRELYEAWKFDF